jgi:predicted permease
LKDGGHHSALLQMVLQPLVAGFQTHIVPMGSEQKQVLVLISSMPSGVLGSVFATHERSGGETASALIVSHVVIALLLVPLMYVFLV